MDAAFDDGAFSLGAFSSDSFSFGFTESVPDTGIFSPASATAYFNIETGNSVVADITFE